MKILLFDAGSLTFNDVKSALERNNCEIDCFFYHFKDRFCDAFFEERISYQLTRKTYEAVISINFFPLLANACNERKIPYISWTYDSPLDEHLSEYFNYDTNYIYMFDRAEVEEYQKKGYKTIFHLPLAINCDRLRKYKVGHTSYYSRDISFVGRIYESELNTLLYSASEYERGYVEALFQAQLRIYGCNFIEGAISDAVIDGINDSLQKCGQINTKLTKKGLSYALSSQITHVERSFLLDELAEHFDVHVYTANNCELSPKVLVHGPVKYYSEMNRVFTSSRLNLCPTLRSIASGIPLRALDIMGVGGVLFSNYQSELFEYFEDGIDMVTYSSFEEAIDKADYYIKNDSVLHSIAENGNCKVEKYFNYDDKIRELLRLNR